MTQTPRSLSSFERDADLDAPRRGRRRASVALLGVLSLATVSACGSDSESSEDTFCAAGDSLESNIEAIADIDIVSGGTDAVTEQVAAIQSDVDQLRDSGSDVAADEISTLDTAVDALASALDGLGDEISTENAQAVASSVGSVVAAAGDVYAQLDTACS